MNVIQNFKMAGYDQCLRARITDINGEIWDYTLQYSPEKKSWSDKDDYLNNAAEDFENEWEVAVRNGSTIHSTELFEKVEDEEEFH